MSDLGYLVWFLATALMVIVVLAVGTMAAAGMLHRPGSRRDRSGSGAAGHVASRQLEPHEPADRPHDRQAA